MSSHDEDHQTVEDLYSIAEAIREGKSIVDLLANATQETRDIYEGRTVNAGLSGRALADKLEQEAQAIHFLTFTLFG
jgi:hypothetical protein